MSIIGVGIDVAEIERFAASLERTPGLARRLFVESELLLPSGGAARHRLPGGAVRRQGGPGQGARCARGLYWTDAEVWCEDSGQPRLRVKGTVAARAEELGVRSWHVSLSHDAGVASAVVIAEGVSLRGPRKVFLREVRATRKWGYRQGAGIGAGARMREGFTVTSTMARTDQAQSVTELPEVVNPGQVAPQDARELSRQFFRRLTELEEGTHEYQYARNTLIEMNMSLVRYAAGRFRSRARRRWRTSSRSA